MFVRKKYIDQLRQGEYVTNAPWIKVETTSGMNWKLVGCFHLDGYENKGGHHAYVDLLERDNQPMGPNKHMIHFTWEGKRSDEPAPPIPLEKTSPEPSGNLPIWKGQVVTLWIEGVGISSERAVNLRTDLPDGEEGNTFFHHSYYLLWKLETEEGPQQPIRTLEERVSDLEKRVTRLENADAQTQEDSNKVY